MIEQVTIVGMGALGILYGDRLSRYLGADHVRFLAAGERLERYRREGAWCNGKKCAFQFSDGTDGEAQLLIFAVKAPALEEAIALASPCVGEETVVLSVLNGVTSEETLSQAFGPEKVLYAVAQGMDAVREDNRLTCTQEGTLFLGCRRRTILTGRQAGGGLVPLPPGGVDARKGGGHSHRMWCKFMLNVGVNQVCMAYARGYGGWRTGARPGSGYHDRAMNEARKVRARQGVLVTQKDLREYVAVLDSLNPEAMPSMRQDALAHRPSEVELFAGTVIQLAEFYGMQVPVNRALYQTIKEMETNW
ncbi:MAG: ketopantoate reductase family protein [Evtepia gabavorous]